MKPSMVAQKYHNQYDSGRSEAGLLPRMEIKTCNMGSQLPNSIGLSLILGARRMHRVSMYVLSQLPNISICSCFPVISIV
jgi:hypothetical protein